MATDTLLGRFTWMDVGNRKYSPIRRSVEIVQQKYFQCVNVTETVNLILNRSIFPIEWLNESHVW